MFSRRGAENAGVACFIAMSESFYWFFFAVSAPLRESIFIAVSISPILAVLTKNHSPGLS